VTDLAIEKFDFFGLNYFLFSKFEFAAARYPGSDNKFQKIKSFKPVKRKGGHLALETADKQQQRRGKMHKERERGGRGRGGRGGSSKGLHSAWNTAQRHHRAGKKIYSTESSRGERDGSRDITGGQ
jgi:hypothetical protein